jgi:hypothetical protein
VCWLLMSGIAGKEHNALRIAQESPRPKILTVLQSTVITLACVIVADWRRPRYGSYLIVHHRHDRLLARTFELPAGAHSESTGACRALRRSSCGQAAYVGYRTDNPAVA